jgi:hypothetical protein
MDIKVCKELSGEFDPETNKCYAKTVFSFDLHTTIDRTKEKHPRGHIDVDFRDPKSENPSARNWTYGGSRRTIELARKDAENIKDLKFSIECRIVDARTGEILEKY